VHLRTLWAPVQGACRAGPAWRCKSNRRQEHRRPFLLSIDAFAFVPRSLMCSSKQRHFPVKLLRLVLPLSPRKEFTPQGPPASWASLLVPPVGGVARCCRHASGASMPCMCVSRSSWEVRQPKPDLLTEQFRTERTTSYKRRTSHLRTDRFTRTDTQSAVSPLACIMHWSVLQTPTRAALATSEGCAFFLNKIDFIKS
jgi:hypothetical protein